MVPRLLMDTHVLVRSLLEPKRLSREQGRALNTAIKRGEPVAFSAMTLLEIAVLSNQGRLVLKKSLEEFFTELEGFAQLRVLPLDYQVAMEAASLGILRDPSDKVIVATARVHRLRLVTSDQRIIDSGLVSVVE